VVPAGIEQAGGKVMHFGMPVDPGNLLLTAELDGKPVLGLPGCAKSPKYNGFDMVLERLAAGLTVGRAEIVRMGAGGLLAEIASRPQPRDDSDGEDSGPQQAPRVAVLVLAAGRSTRMGGPNKLLADIGGRPLVRIAAEEALASRARPVIVVTGHQRDAVEAALAGLKVERVHNPDFADGLSTSLKAGLAALPGEVDGAVILLGDMPQVRASLIDRLVGAFDPERGALVVVPTIDGKRGNPVVWARRFFPELMTLEGDIGARHVIGRYAEAVTEVPLTDQAVLIDVDTPEALSKVRAELEGT
jgi:molybdenum cofactor cytidylyltransferase